MRLIDADRINFYKATVARGTHSFDNVEIVEKSQIDRMPTIDPESLRPRARWLGEIVRVNGTMSQECSNCHRIRPIDDFCAACGAKMNEGAYSHALHHLQKWKEAIIHEM